MTPERYLRVRVVYQLACELEGPARVSLLDRECAGDVELRDEVESLLAFHDDRPDGLDEPQLGIGRELLEPTRLTDGDEARAAIADGGPAAGLSPGEPQFIGPYRILRRIGQGGMGVVYLAEQDNPRRTVAVKVMRGGGLTSEMLRRFKREAHLLGQLQHPGIAHIYDAGTATIGGGDCAFFAMEFIDGVTLGELATRKELTTRQRLELVAHICDAVQHAHDKGVIHRDLKPGNILVTGEGIKGLRDSGIKQPRSNRPSIPKSLNPSIPKSSNPSVFTPKVLDFGVARATNADQHTLTMQTDAGQLVGTLQYMSPEQVGGRTADLDARSDVYALGVVTYELLTGNPPYRIRDLTVAQVARTIQEVEPTRLSAADSRFRGDLETILAKALEKDRTRRYASAAEFASDIRRYLGNEPIVARPATAMYRLRKFAQRNRALVAGVLIAFVALAAGLVSTTILYLKADDARKTAERQREIAQRESAIAKSINSFLVDDMLAAPNPWEARGRSVTVASVLDNAAAKARSRFAHTPDVEAAVQAMLGQSYAALGLYSEAQPLLDRAFELQGQLPNTTEAETGEALRLRANNLQFLGRFDEAETTIRDALKRIERLFGAESPETAAALETLGDVQIGKSLYKDAEKTLREAIRIRRLHPREGDLGPARATNTLGSALHYSGELAEAEKLKLEALAEFREIAGERHPLVAQTLNDLGANCSEQDRYDDAVRYFRQAEPLLIEHLGPEHSIVLICRRNLASALSFSGHDDEAEPMLRANIAASERTLGPEHPETLGAINCLATLFLRARRSAEAAPLLQTLLERSDKSLGPLHAETLKYASNLAWCEVHLDDLVAAEAHFRRAVTGFEQTLGPTHPNAMNALDGLAQLLAQKKDWPAAADCKRRILAARAAAGLPEDMDAALNLNHLGGYLMNAKDFAAARPPLERCIEICKGTLDANDWRLAEVTGKLGECLSFLGEREAAESNLLAALAALRSDPPRPAADISTALERLIAHYERAGQPEDAAKRRAELAAIAKP